MSMKQIATLRSRSVKAIRLMACLTALAWPAFVLAEGSSIPYGRGGPIGARELIQQYNQSGELFRIEGHCQSSCTTLLAIRNVCVDPSATLLFHAWLRPDQQGQAPNPVGQ